MSNLPLLFSEWEPPADQPVHADQAAVYIGVFVVKGPDSWVVVEHVRRFLKFGRVERWAPVFDCAIPPELHRAIEAAAPAERYFQITFRGIPTEKGRFGHAGQCIRDVRISSISHLMEGTVPPWER